MRGVVLAGGIGSRLFPLTRVTNKHLLPVYDKPMIFYPLQILVDAGIRDILIVTGGHNAGDFLRLLQNGKEFGLGQLSFAYQEGEGGIADALRLAEPWAKGDSMRPRRTARGVTGGTRPPTNSSKPLATPGVRPASSRPIFTRWST